MKWTSSFLLCSFDIKRQEKFKNVYLVHTNHDKSKTRDLPKNSTLKIHYPGFDAGETSKKMEKMAVCVKPFHLNFNRALWVRAKVISIWGPWLAQEFNLLEGKNLRMV